MNRPRHKIEALFLSLVLLAGCAHVEQKPYLPLTEPSSLSRELRNRILALDPEHLSEEEISQVLSKCPAPRMILLEGSLRFVSMESFARFLVVMGYPEDRVRDPRNGSYQLRAIPQRCYIPGDNNTRAEGNEREAQPGLDRRPPLRTPVTSRLVKASI